MAGSPQDIRRDGDFPVMVAGADEGSGPGKSPADGDREHPGPTPGLPPHGTDVAEVPVPTPTDLPGEPAPLDDRPLSGDDGQPPPA